MPSHVITLREDATYENLHPAQRAFVDRFLETGDAIEAARVAGYRDGGKKQTSLSQKAKALRRELAVIIDDRIEHYARSADFCLLAVNTLKYLAQHAESETVRLNAAKEIANRTLQAPVQRKEVTHNHRLARMSTEDLDARISELRERLNQGVTIDAQRSEDLPGVET